MMQNARALFAAGLLATSLALSASPAPAQTMSKVRFGVDSGTLGAQIWVAKDKGFFAKQGIDADVQAFAFGIDTVDAELTGRIDFGIALDFPTTTRLASEQLVIVSAALEPEPGFYTFVARKPIASAKDLAGKPIGISKATAQHLDTIKYVETGGLKASDVNLVPLTSNLEIVAALKSGRIDAAFLTRDALAQISSDPAFAILGTDAMANVRQYAYFSVRKAFATERGADIVASLKALAEATDWIAGHIDETADIIAQHNKGKVEIVKLQMVGQTYTVALKPKYLETFKTIAAFAFENGMTKTLLDPAAFIDASFLKKAAPERVTLP